jgi:hypothetical protein
MNQVLEIVGMHVHLGIVRHRESRRRVKGSLVINCAGLLRPNNVLQAIGWKQAAMGRSKLAHHGERVAALQVLRKVLGGQRLGESLLEKFRI